MTDINTYSSMPSSRDNYGAFGASHNGSSAAGAHYVGSGYDAAANSNSSGNINGLHSPLAGAGGSAHGGNSHIQLPLPSLSKASFGAVGSAAYQPYPPQPHSQLQQPHHHQYDQQFAQQPFYGAPLGDTLGGSRFGAPAPVYDEKTGMMVSINSAPFGLPHIGMAAGGLAAPGLGIPGGQIPVEKKKRVRRKHDEIERYYVCNYKDCTKGYGTLNHLNAHVATQNHGQKRRPEEFKEIRATLRERKKKNEELKKLQRQKSLGGAVGTSSNIYGPLSEFGTAATTTAASGGPSAGSVSASAPASVSQHQDFPNPYNPVKMYNTPSASQPSGYGSFSYGPLTFSAPSSAYDDWKTASGQEPAQNPSSLSPISTTTTSTNQSGAETATNASPIHGGTHHASVPSIYSYGPNSSAANNAASGYLSYGSYTSA